MLDHIDVRGASGRAYRFLRMREGRGLSPAGGNYLYGRFTAGRFELLFSGEAQNLLKDARDRWSEAVERFQASDLYTRLNLSERVRQLEQADIVAGNAAPMNLDEDAGPVRPLAAAPAPSVSGALGGEDRVELAAGAPGEGGEGSLVRDLPGGAEEFAPGRSGERAPDTDPPRP